MSENMNLILFVIILVFAGIFYCFGNFYSKIPGVSNNFWKIFFISILCVIGEYTLRVPAIFFLVKDMSSILIYTIIQSVTFLVVILFSKYVLKEEVQPITYALLIVIMTLIIAHNIILKKGH
jgi:multidrug transporter EmrE-like cation transporter